MKYVGLINYFILILHFWDHCTSLSSAPCIFRAIPFFCSSAAVIAGSSANTARVISDKSNFCLGAGSNFSNTLQHCAVFIVLLSIYFIINSVKLRFIWWIMWSAPRSPDLVFRPLEISFIISSGYIWQLWWAVMIVECSLSLFRLLTGGSFQIAVTVLQSFLALFSNFIFSLRISWNVFHFLFFCSFLYYQRADCQYDRWVIWCGSFSVCLRVWVTPSWWRNLWGSFGRYVSFPVE